MVYLWTCSAYFSHRRLQFSIRCSTRSCYQFVLQRCLSYHTSRILEFSFRLFYFVFISFSRWCPFYADFCCRFSDFVDDELPSWQFISHRRNDISEFQIHPLAICHETSQSSAVNSKHYIVDLSKKDVRW